MTDRRGVSSFGQRAERRDLGLPDPGDEVGEPVATSAPAAVPAGMFRINVVPVLDEAALAACGERIAATVRDAVVLGTTEGMAVAEQILDSTDDPL